MRSSKEQPSDTDYEAIKKHWEGKLCTPENAYLLNIHIAYYANTYKRMINYKDSHGLISITMGEKCPST